MTQRILRRLSYGDLLDEMFDLYREHFVVFAGIVAVVYLPMEILLHSLVPRSLLWSYLAIPVTLFMRAATTWAVSEAYLGRQPTILGSYRAIGRRILPFLGTMLVTYLIIFLGCMLFLVPGIIFLFRYAFTSEVFIVEGKKYSEARARSRQVTGEWGRIFVIGLLTTLLGWVVGMGVSGLVGAVLHVHRTSWLAPAGHAFPAGLAYGISGSLTFPISMIAFILLYYDIRVKKEGFDIELLAQNMGATAGG